MLNIIEIKYQRKQLKKIIFLKKEKLIIIIVLDVKKICFFVYVLNVIKKLKLEMIIFDLSLKKI